MRYDFQRQDIYECGAAEFGRKYEGPHGTKILNEGYSKIPKTLKDILDTRLSYILIGYVKKILIKEPLNSVS